MLNSHGGGFSESEMLDRIKAARSEEEPQAEPTESEEPVSLQDDAVEEAVEEEVEAESVSEELESDEPEEIEASDSDEESVYLIGDEEITLSELKELRESGLRQSDYTRKTQELSEQRKDFEAKSSRITELSSTLDSLISELHGSINNEIESVDWDELADLDPSEYLKKKAAIEKRADKLKAAQAEQAKLLQAKAQEEIQVLASKMPDWAGEEGEMNRKKDTDIALKHLSGLGFTDAELSNVVDHRFYMMAIKAAKYDALKDKAPAIKKKVSKAPKVTTATKTAKRKVTKLEESMGKLKKTGSQRDAVDALKAYLTR